MQIWIKYFVSAPKWFHCDWVSDHNGIIVVQSLEFQKMKPQNVFTQTIWRQGKVRLMLRSQWGPVRLLRNSYPEEFLVPRTLCHESDFCSKTSLGKILPKCAILWIWSWHFNVKILNHIYQENCGSYWNILAINHQKNESLI